MQKFGFRIKTKSGSVVENLVIHGQDQALAETKLLQMYPKAQVLECRPLDDAPRGEGSDLESVLSLIINSQNRPEPPPG